MPYQSRNITLDLSGARTKQANAETGNRVQLIAASDASASLEIYVRHDNGTESGPFILRSVGDYVEFPESFNSLMITNAAQTGYTVTLAVIDMEPIPLKFDYFANARGTIDSIAEPVITKPGQFTKPVIQTIGTTAILIAAANPNRLALKVVNTAASATIWIGTDATVAANNGDPCFPQNVVVVPGDQDVWAISTAAGAIIPVTEIVK